MLNLLQTWISRTQFRLSPELRANLWKRLSSLCERDVPITTAIQFLADSRNKGVPQEFCVYQLTAMRTQSFADAARGWVPQEELIMIELTQEGRIAEGFNQAARIANVRKQLRSTLLSNLTYPISLLIVGSFVIALLPPYAMQMMLEITDVENWPPVSRSVLEFSQFIQKWGLLIFSGFAITIILSFWAAPRFTGFVRGYLEWYPPFAIYRKLLGPEVLTAWLALMQAGVQRLRALEQLLRGMPPYLASHVKIMRSRMYAGANTDAALDTGLFSAETLDDLRIYERLGTFNERADDVSAADIERTLANFHASIRVLSAVILLIVGGSAVWIYIGIAQIAFTLQQSSTSY